MTRLVLAAAVLLGLPALAQPQGAPTSFLRELTETRRYTAGRPIASTPTPDGGTVLFLRSSPTSSALSLWAFDVASGQARELLTPEGVLGGVGETLSREEAARRERMRVGARGFTTFALSKDGRRVLLTLSGRLFLLERASGQVRELKAAAGGIDPRLSADGEHVAYVRGSDLYQLDLRTGREHRVSRGGTPERTHGLAEFVAMEEMGRFTGYWWSPDARQLAFTESDTRGVEKLALADPAHPERAPERVPYPRPGTPNARVRLFVAQATGGSPREVRWDLERYPYLATVRWPERGPLTLLVQNRAQTEELLLAADPRTGATRTLLTERDPAWVNLDQDFPLWREDGTGFLWQTERNGDTELELRSADGRLLRSRVAPGAGFRALVRYVEAEDTLYFLGGPNPTERYLWRSVRGGAPERVSQETPALESATVTPDGRVVVLTSESPTHLRRTRVLRADGTTSGELPSVAKEPPFTPRLEVRQVGKAGYWTSLVRPRAAKPGVKLPVIVRIYGAAHPLVQQGMTLHLDSQWMADQGYLVVSIDGRGTWFRGRAWERALKYDFVGRLDEQVEALRALAAQVPELDLARVGIEGWSNGGYMAAMAVLERPDVFRAAVAGAPVVDWRDYDSHLTERFLGLPQEHPEAYARNSLLPAASAPGPMGKLLLIHGTADDNVFLGHTLRLCDALLRAGKPFSLLTLSGSTHMPVDPLSVERRWERTMRHFHESL
ncbi:prolyl oligopeptidase family serine peptidase [Aggregicoccus sp. 17bor-14]|uniref:S9 family peptidase n=1 Tax=Myxococcaceae TaxID=31 RepID=UPI00129C18ED|nr:MULTISPECIES: S9 family peptidase [Myxococcaceae]MBF5043279.1 DPP IV N-terminal domain-containing protein [Simulacricoccus sp. 17bor-14]MRI89036.1 prolyl oligopeptidase family serine peptidase [Aggregicoccus sp. 17bor-14]